MGKEKLTFTDPQTGGEVESTWLAQGVMGLVGGLVIGLTSGLIAVLVFWQVVHAVAGGGNLDLKLVFGVVAVLLLGIAPVLIGRRTGGLISGLVAVPFFALIFMLTLGVGKSFLPQSIQGTIWLIGSRFFDLAEGKFSQLLGGLVLAPVGWLSLGLNEKIHNRVARYQHYRRQRILKRKREDATGISDGVLSRVKAPGEPFPTEAVLSQAKEPGVEPEWLRGEVAEKEEVGSDVR